MNHRDKDSKYTPGNIRLRQTDGYSRSGHWTESQPEGLPRACSEECAPCRAVFVQSSPTTSSLCWARIPSRFAASCEHDVRAPDPSSSDRLGGCMAASPT